MAREVRSLGFRTFFCCGLRVCSSRALQAICYVNTYNHIIILYYEPEPSRPDALKPETQSPKALNPKPCEP